MSNKKVKAIYIILTGILVFGLTVSFQSFVLAWMEPTATPPGTAGSFVVSEDNVENGAYFIDSAGLANQVWKADGSGRGQWGSIALSETTGNIDASRVNNIPTEIPSGAIMAFNLNSCPAGWSKFNNANGRVLVGIDITDSSFDTLLETGGEKTHTLTLSEIPSHNHTFYHGAYGSDNRSVPTNAGDTQDGTTARTKYTNNSGSGNSHNNLQPYVTLLYCVKD